MVKTEKLCYTGIRIWMKDRQSVCAQKTLMGGNHEIYENAGLWERLRLCGRRGGADSAGKKAGAFEMEMYNADGTRAEMCGNGIRCVGKFVYDKGLTDKTDITVISVGKIKYLTLLVKEGKVETVRVNMGAPELAAALVPVLCDKEQAVDEPIRVQGREYRMTCVSMGNPHAVVFVEDVEAFPIEEIGPYFENHERFPRRTNTEFVKVIDQNTVQMRVWERGTGETLACGTGACATVVACVLNGLTAETVRVKLLGGDLTVTWDREADMVYMTGPAVTVFEGTL